MRFFGMVKKSRTFLNVTEDFHLFPKSIYYKYAYNRNQKNDAWCSGSGDHNQLPFWISYNWFARQTNVNILYS